MDLDLVYVSSSRLLDNFGSDFWLLSSVAESAIDYWAVELRVPCKNLPTEKAAWIIDISLIDSASKAAQLRNPPFDALSRSSIPLPFPERHDRVIHLLVHLGLCVVRAMWLPRKPADPLPACRIGPSRPTMAPTTKDSLTSKSAIKWWKWVNFKIWIVHGLQFFPITRICLRRAQIASWSGGGDSNGEPGLQKAVCCPQGKDVQNNRH